MRRLAPSVGRSPFTLTLTDPETGATVLRTADRLRQVAGLLTAPSVVVDEAGTALSLELRGRGHPRLR